MDLNEITAAEIMSTELTTVDPEEKLSIAEVLMLEEKCRGITSRSKWK